MEKNKEASFIRIAAVLLLICGIMAGIVAGVHSLTAQTIADAQLLAKEDAIIRIFAEYDREDPADSITETEKPAEFTAVNAVSRVEINGALAGYAVDVTSKGYGGEGISLMVGVSADGDADADGVVRPTIISVQIINANSETPGLGQRVSEESFLHKFIGQLGGMKLNSEVEAIAGATISSRAVVEGANDALAAVEKITSEGDGK